MKGLYTLLLGLLVLLSSQLTAQNDLSITVESASAGQGQQLCLDITGDNFDQILGFQFSLNYDAAVLEYVSGTGSTFFGQPVFIQNSDPGDLRVTWNVFSADVLTETEPFLIGEICFNVLVETETSIDITNQPISIDVTGANGPVTDLELNNGTVNMGTGNQATCSDGIQNGNETGVDCGGPDCPACPSCNDGIQNGDETGVDCGGSCTPCMTNGDDLVFNLSSGNGGVGTEVCLDVTTANFEMIGAFQFSMNYDPAILEYSQVMNLAFPDINVVQPGGSPGEIRTSWVYFQPDLVGGNLADGAVVFTICFNVLQETGTNVVFSSMPIGIEGFDTNNNPLTVVTNGGTVNGGGSMPTCDDGIMNGTETGVDCGGSCAPCDVGNETCGEGSSDLHLCVDDACGDIGEEVCLDIVVANFVDITGMEFRVNYAGGNLDYTMGSSHPDLIGGATIVESQDGQLRILWFDPTPAFEGVTLPDGDAVITVCFTLENDLNTPVTLSLVNLTDPSGSVIDPIIVNQGSINDPSCDGVAPTCNDGIQNGNETGVDCGGPDCAACPTCNDGIQNGNETGVDCGGSCVPCSTGGDDLTFNLSSADATVGSTVCLNVTVENFDSIGAFQFSINYDPAILQFVEATNLAFPDINVVQPAGTPGEIRTSWVYFEPDTEGESLADGSVVFSICFTVLQEVTTNVIFSGMPIGIEGFDTNNNPLPVVTNNGVVNGGNGGDPTCTDGVQNGNETGVDCGGPDCPACPTCNDGIQNGDETGIDCGGSCTPCMVEGGNCGENSNDFNICVEEVCGDVGGQVCMNIGVSQFNSIVGFEFRINYNGANLDYVSSTSHPNLTGGATVNPASDGELRVLWFDPTPQFEGVTIPDGEGVINVCFTIETAAIIPVSLTQVSISDINGVINPVIINDGFVDGTGCSSMPTCNDGIQNGDETGVDCGGSCEPCDTGAICGAGSGDFHLCAEEACGDVGQEVCLDIDVSQFNSVVGFEFRVNYNGANLEYTSSTSHPDLIGGATVNPASDGELRVLWFDPTPQFEGVTIPDGEAVITVCFTIETAAFIPVTLTQASFSDINGVITPVVINNGSVDGTGCTTGPTCNDGIQNGNETGVDCGGPDCAACPTCDDGIQNGNETGVDCGGSCEPCMVNMICGEGSSDLNICLPDVCGDIGEEVCIDLTVTNFTSVVGFQFRIIYPGADLQYVSNTSNSAILGGATVNPTSDGELRVLWFDPTPQFEGATIPDQEALLTVCFNVETTDEAAIELTQVSFSDVDGTIDPVIVNNGSVNGPACSGGPTCNDGIQNGDETGVDCGGSCEPCMVGGDLTLNIGDDMANVGEQACVDVTVQNFIDIQTLDLTLNYDPAILQLASVVATTDLPGLDGTSFVPGGPGILNIDWQGTDGFNLAEDAVLFTVCFTVLDGTETDVSFAGGASANDGDGMAVNVVTTPGTINLGGIGGGFDNLTFIMGSENGEDGISVCLPVPVFNFENITSFSFTINYDPNRLSYDSFMGAAELLVGAGFQVSNPTPGEIRVLWLYQNPDFAGISVADGTTAFDVCFRVLEACESLVEITDSAVDIVATDNNGDSVPVDDIDGGINIGVPCDGGCNPDNLILEVGNASGLTGDEVCIDVTAENFSGLTDLQFTLNYDPAIVDFNSVSNFGLGSISTANFTIGPAGTIVFNWSSGTGTGQSITDGGTVFTLCFEVLDVQQTPINFNSTPTPIIARNACGENGTNVGVVPNGGIINPGAPIGDDLTLRICCIDGDVGEQVCVPIKAYNFVEVLGFQFSLDYDPTVVQFDNIGPNPAVPLLANNSSPGDIRVTWSDLSGNSATLADQDTLVTICFTILTDDPAPITFSNMPIPIEFVGANGLIDATLLNCAINGTGAPVISDISVTPLTCHDAQDARIELTISGPTTLSYEWMPAVSSGPIASNLGPGTYMVVVTNTSTGESTTETITVSAPTPFSIDAIAPVVNNVSCFGEQDGSITITPTGGVSPYTIDWSGSLPDGALQQTNLDAGTYGVSVTDVNGCERSLSFTIDEPSEITIQGLVTNIGENPGSIIASAMGGTPFPNTPPNNYTYSWSGPNNFSATDLNISGLTDTGTYCLTVLDMNNCVEIRCFEVCNSLRIIDSVIDGGCDGFNNGAIDLTVAGCSSEFTFSWIGPNEFSADTEDINNLAPGSYSVTVTNGVPPNDEQVTSTFAVDASQINLSANINPASSGNNGSIDLTVSGGLPPFTYRWTGPNGFMAETQDIDNLEGGEYCVLVTDSRGCERTNCYTVTAEVMTVIGTTTEPTSCVDSLDGVAMVMLLNGVPPFVVSAEPGGFTGTSNTNDVTIELPAGMYTLTITDDQGQTVTTDVTITEPEPIAVTGTSIVSDTEDAECTGSITLMLAGGTGTYTVEWNVPGLEGQQITGLCAGDYTPTITDENGCVFIGDPISIGQLAEEATINSVECPGDNSGNICVTVTGGVEGYTYAWRVAGETEVIGETNCLDGLVAGAYTVTIQDATGAVIVRTYEIETELGFSFTTMVESDFNGFGVSCANAADGQAVAIVSGTGTYSYEWLLGEQLVGIDSVLTDAIAGTYTLRIRSDAGCEESGSVIITGPEELRLQSDVVNVSCTNERDGLISLTITGGVAPYEYLWSNGSTLPRAQFLRAGDYSVLVNDANGCLLEQSFSLEEPEPLVVTTETTDATEGCNGTVTVLPLGGPGTYNYRWPQLPGQGNAPVARGLCPGEYTIEVFDDNDCQTMTVVATVRDRRFPCLSERNIITPNGDGLNETFVLFCTDGAEANDNTLEIYNRWGQLVFQVNDYNCSAEGGLNCFEGRTNDGTLLPAGAYYYVLNYFNPLGERLQQRGSITILQE